MIEGIEGRHHGVYEGLYDVLSSCSILLCWFDDVIFFCCWPQIIYVGGLAGIITRGVSSASNFQTISSRHL